MSLRVAGLLCAAAAAAPSFESREQLIEAVNAVPGISWRAGEGARFANSSLGVSKPLCGFKGMMASSLRGSKSGQLEVVTARPEGLQLPANFDAAQQWPECAKVINDIRDQSNCGCCWAFGPASAASDRLCISSKGKHQVPLSAQELCFCASNDGCDGGFIGHSWARIVKKGLTTGGQQLNTGVADPDAFAGQKFCSKYSLPHCHHHGPQGQDPFAPEGTTGCPEVQQSPQCPLGCDADADSQHRDFVMDRFALWGGFLQVFDEDQSLAEALMRDGPVTTALSIHEDFETYVSGVYRHVAGKFVGGHVVRLVGFGTTDAGLRYWRVANSWNPFWGEAGHFRIVRGEDHCGIESNAATAAGGNWLQGSELQAARMGVLRGVAEHSQA